MSINGSVLLVYLLRVASLIKIGRRYERQEARIREVCFYSGSFMDNILLPLR